MPKIIPLTNDGCRRVTVTLGENSFILETYYLPNIRRWLLDILDAEENPILTGISLNVGVSNLVKGKTQIFEGQALRCVSPEVQENNTPESLGTTCFLYYYAKGETPPQLYTDKMIEE